MATHRAMDSNMSDDDEVKNTSATEHYRIIAWERVAAFTLLKFGVPVIVMTSSSRR